MEALFALPPGQAIALAAITLVAAIVRGFTGFALSAVVMATAVIILPPIELIPILLIQEILAGLLLARGGWGDADKVQGGLLVVGAWIGFPIGLSLTLYLPEDRSKLTALIIILVLAALQLAKLRIPGLASRVGTTISGVVSGTVTGLASVGGMVVALYVLAQGSQARTMRGTLVFYLFLASIGELIFQLLLGFLTPISVVRSLGLLPITAAGVFIGRALFIPKWEPYYRPFCLSLLMVLAVAGLVRMGVMSF